MSIKTSLKNLVTAMGGSPAGKTVPQLIDEIAVLKDPLFALKVDTDVAADTDLLGKVIGDLQEGVVVRDGRIFGHLKYVTEYTGFSGDPAEQQGYYVVLHATVPGQTGVTIKAQSTQGPVTLDEDGILILFVRDKDVQTVTFTAIKDGYASASKTFRLNGLDLEKVTV